MKMEYLTDSQIISSENVIQNPGFNNSKIEENGE